MRAGLYAEPHRSALECMRDAATASDALGKREKKRDTTGVKGNHTSPPLRHGGMLDRSLGEDMHIPEALRFGRGGPYGRVNHKVILVRMTERPPVKACGSHTRVGEISHPLSPRHRQPLQSPSRCSPSP